MNEPTALPVFGLANWITLTIYLALTVGIGLFLARRETDVKDFFLAGGRIPWWAAGISIFATQLSGITFLAIPQEAYLHDWTTGIGILMIPVVAPIVIYFFLPHFRRLHVTSIYEYLEHRFSLSVRLFGSLSFLLFQVGRMGIVLFLPGSALSAATGIDIYVCITVMGAISIIYTILGGIEAVIWTDVIQVIVLLGGATLCLFLIVGDVPGGMDEIISNASQYDKLKMFNWGEMEGRPNSLELIIGFFFLNLIPYTSDQSVIQRYLTTRNEHEAAKSIWLSAAMTIPLLVLFFGLGTALFVYYQIAESDAVPIAHTIEILPIYISTHLPPGIAGFVIAGVFAASMSSLDSSMNSMAAVTVSDFCERLMKENSDTRSMTIARTVTLVSGLVGTGTAIIIAAARIEPIFEFFQMILGMLGGSIAGVFVLGVFFRRTNSTHVLIAAVVGLLTQLSVFILTDISGYLYAAVGVSSCVSTGILLGVFWPRHDPIVVDIPINQSILDSAVLEQHVGNEANRFEASDEPEGDIGGGMGSAHNNSTSVS